MIDEKKKEDNGPGFEAGGKRSGLPLPPPREALQIMKKKL
jgi:hypothetical protein